mmetsp:Transcript_43775/g.108914  ORF Transcript_43775/g.108914 Transcript_43775/m.108914 type:complete len:230 (+) Transcript_43775:229-918(+)
MGWRGANSACAYGRRVGLYVWRQAAVDPGALSLQGRGGHSERQRRVRKRWAGDAWCLGVDAECADGALWGRAHYGRWHDAATQRAVHSSDGGRAPAHFASYIPPSSRVGAEVSPQSPDRSPISCHRTGDTRSWHSSFNDSASSAPAGVRDHDRLRAVSPTLWLEIRCCHHSHTLHLRIFHLRGRSNANGHSKGAECCGRERGAAVHRLYDQLRDCQILRRDLPRGAQVR